MSEQNTSDATAVAVSSSDPFPLDWNEWRTQWNEWRDNAHGLNHYSHNPFPPKNFLADEVLGVFRVGANIVELSEVTFPNLSDRDENGRLIDRRDRYVGITYWIGGETQGCESGGIVSSFAQLETALGL